MHMDALRYDYSMAWARHQGGVGGWTGPSRTGDDDLTSERAHERRHTTSFTYDMAFIFFSFNTNCFINPVSSTFHQRTLSS